MKPVKERVIKVTFNADRHASMQWNFRPQQTEIFVRPGSSIEPVLLVTPLIGVLNHTSLHQTHSGPDSGLELDPIGLQHEMFKMMFVLQVVPGETALAFYRAKNPTDKPITGISTYNVVPFEAGQYFNKIQVVQPALGQAAVCTCPPVSSLMDRFFRCLFAVFLL